MCENTKLVLIVSTTLLRPCVYKNMLTSKQKPLISNYTTAARHRKDHGQDQGRMLPRGSTPQPAAAG